MDFFGLRRQKTMSESSDDGGGSQQQQRQQQQQQQQHFPGFGPLPQQDSSSNKQLVPTGTNLQTNADQGRYFHDDHGMIPYSYYERKPQYYEVEGKVQYKYFNQYKNLSDAQKKKKAEKEMEAFNKSKANEEPEFFYDYDGGKVPFHTYHYPTDRHRFSMK